ncbi:MAG: LCP family protein [Anaerolineaceae bacterium]|nr:LCP family protein [Anaerolineaceae bacterium]
MKKIKKLFLRSIPLVLVAVFLLSACSEISSANISQSNGVINEVPKDATATLTPFLPVASTVTPLATRTPLVTNTPTLTPTRLTPTPLPWNYGLESPEGQVRFAIFGSDYRPSSGFRTDVIMIVSINPEEKTATVVSFPRDLYVTVPGRGEQRINTAFSYGGIELFNATMQENFGFQVDYFVITNFTGFVNIIDNLGGIDVNATANLSDKCDLPFAVNGYCSVGPGTVHMDGRTALWYARSRYSTSDFDRTRRAQEIILAILNRLLRFDVISKIPSLYNIYSANVETNIDLATVLSLAPLAPTLAKSENTRSFAISVDQTTAYRTPSGGAVLLPNYDKIYPMLKEALYTP